MTETTWNILLTLSNDWMETKESWGLWSNWLIQSRAQVTVILVNVKKSLETKWTSWNDSCLPTDRRKCRKKILWVCAVCATCQGKGGVNSHSEDMSNGEWQNPKWMSQDVSGAMPPFSGSNYVKAILQAVVTVEESATRHSKKKSLDDFSNGEEMPNLFRCQLWRVTALCVLTACTKLSTWKRSDAFRKQQVI